MTFFTGDPSYPTRFGTDTGTAGAGLPDDLFLKLFGGEVLNAFYAQTLMKGKTFEQNVQGRKSSQFPRVWKLGAHYHTAGEELMGQTTEQTEVTITLDGLAVSDVAFYDLDMAMAHFEVRSMYTASMGAALAELYDKNCMRSVIIAARATTLGGNFPIGKRLTTADVTPHFADGTLTAGATNALGIVGAARAARLYFRQNNVPDGLPFYGVISPALMDQLKWARLASASGAIYGDMIFQKLDYMGANQSVAKPIDTITIEGITFMPSNLLPSTDETADTSVWSKYRYDYSDTIGIIWSPQAVGTLNLLGLRMEMMRDVRRKEVFITAAQAHGHGTLRQEVACEITSLATL